MSGRQRIIRNVEWTGPDGRVAVAEASGEIDMEASTAFQEDLLDAMARRPDRLVVDLSDVGYMDSSGVASLVKVLARSRREKVNLVLAGMVPRVRGVFEITRLDTVFDIRSSREEAVQT